MNNKLISSLVLLLILAFLKHENANYTIFTSFALIYFILSFYSKKFIHNVLIAFSIVSILSILSIYLNSCYFNLNNNYLELFENENEDDSEKEENKEIKNTDPVTMDDITDLDDMIDEDFNKTSNDNSKINTNNMDHATAQKETFRLINSVKLLEKTIQDLAPTLKQGKNIINALDKMKL